MDSSSTRPEQQESTKKKTLKSSSRSFLFSTGLQGDTSFVGLLCFFCLVFAMSLCAFFYMCPMVTCWERVGLLAPVRGV